MIRWTVKAEQWFDLVSDSCLSTRRDNSMSADIMTAYPVAFRCTSAVQSWCVKQGTPTPGARRDATTPLAKIPGERERLSPRLQGTLFPRVRSAYGGQQSSPKAQVWKQGVFPLQHTCRVWDRILIALLFSPVMNLNLNLVFIAGCVLAAVAMISAVFVYKAKISRVRYQPLPTCET